MKIVSKFEIDLNENISLKEVENKLHKALKEQYCQIFKQTLENYDEALLKANSKEIIQNKGKRTRGLNTLLGEVIFSRSRVKLSSGKYVFLLDEYLGIAKRVRSTENVQKECIISAVRESSYNKAAKKCGKQFNTNISGSCLHKWLNQHEFSFKEAPLPKKISAVPELAFAELDGTMVPIRGEKHRKEILLGITYTDKKLTSSNKAKTPRFKLQNKYYFGCIGTKQAFGARFRDFADHTTLFSKAKEKLVLSDGDRGLLDSQYTHFFDSYHQLDIYHLKKQISQTFKQHDQVSLKIWKLIHQNKFGEVYAFLNNNKFASEEDNLALKNYIFTNEHNILTYQRLPKDFPAHLRPKGSGAMEKSIDLATRRIKGQGKSWSISGLDNMYALVISDLNNTLPDFVNLSFEGKTEKETKFIFTEEITTKNILADLPKKKFPYYAKLQAGLPILKGPLASKYNLSFFRQLTF